MTDRISIPALLFADIPRVHGRCGPCAAGDHESCWGGCTCTHIPAVEVPDE